MEALVLLGLSPPRMSFLRWNAVSKPAPKRCDFPLGRPPPSIPNDGLTSRINNAIKSQYFEEVASKLDRPASHHLTGSACISGSIQPSHVPLARGDRVVDD